MLSFICMELGQRIQSCRREKGISQEELADILGVSRQAVQKWESGASQPELSNLLALGEALGVSMDFLLKGDHRTESSETPAPIEIRASTPSPAPTPASSGEALSKGIFVKKHLDPRRIRAIKIWMIIGCVLTPMAAGGSYLNNQYKPEALFFLLLYLVTIPLCVAAIKKCKKAESQSELVGLGVACLILVSLLGGVFMLTSGDRYFVEDRPKTNEELREEEQKRIQAQELEKKTQQERERQLELQNERDRISRLRSSKITLLRVLYRDFKRKEYNPSDISKANFQKEKAIRSLDSLKSEEEMSKVVTAYKNFLAGFSLDEVFYARRKRKVKKFFVIFAPSACILTAVAILTGTVFVPLGKYNYAMSLISQGKYDEANHYLDGNGWEDSLTQITVNKARSYFDANNYEEGIDVLYKLGAEVEVAYDLNGGEGKTSDDFKKPRYIENNPTRTGYFFNKWSVKSYSIGGSNINYKTSLNLVAEWKVRQYSITYNLNGGSCSNPKSYTIESKTLTLNNPTKKGYSFEGWTGTNLITPSKEVTISKGSYGELVYFANWNADSYTIHLDSDGGECISNEVVATYDANFELPFPTRIGYTFLGWYDGETKWDSGVWQRASDLYLKAKWETKVFALSFELNGGSSGQLPSSYTYFDDDIHVSNPSRTGYAFKGWTGTDLAEPTTDLIIASHSLGDKQFEAQWEGLTYQVTFDLGGGSMDKNVMTVIFGEACELPVPAKTGYSFEGWKYSNTFITSGIWAIPNDVMLVAQWDIAVFDLSFDLAGGTIDVEPPSTYTYFDEDINVPDPTRKGYTFSGWKNLDNNEITPSGLVIPSGSLENKAFIALWNGVSYHVTFDANGGDCDISETNIVFGSEVTLPVPTKAGSYFNGWWIDNVTILYDGKWEIDHDVSLVAHWRTNPTPSYYPSFSWGYYPQYVEEDSEILVDLPNATDVDGDGYIEYAGNKYATSRCLSNSGRKSDSGLTTFTYGTLYFFRVGAIRWLGVPNSTSYDSTSSNMHSFKVLDKHSFGTSNSYSSSSIKQFLENEFYNKMFTNFEKKKVSKPYLAATPSDCYDTAGGSGYPTDYAVCRGVTLSNSSKKTVYWVTKTNGTDVCMGVSGETSAGYSTSPTDTSIGVRPLITFYYNK